MFIISKIVLHPKKDKSSTFSVRAHNDTLAKYDELTRVTGHSRNELINIAMKYFVENVVVMSDDQDKATVEIKQKGRPPKGKE